MHNIKVYIQFVKPYWKMIAFTITIGILKFGIPLALPLILKYVVDDLLLGDLPNEVKIDQLTWIMIGSFLVFIVLRVPIEYYRQYYAQLVSNQVLYDVRNKLYEHMQKLSLRYYHNNKVGEIISRVINDVEQTKNFVLTGLMNIWLDMVTLVIAVVIMLFIDVKLTLVAIAIFPLYGIAIKFFYQRLRILTKDRSQSLAELQGHLHERVQGISVVRSFVQEDVEQARFQKRNDRFLDTSLAHTRWNANTFAVVNTITDIAPLLVIWYSAYHVIGGDLTIGTMIAFYAYLERLYSPLRRLVNSSTTLTQSVASIDRVVEFMEEPYDLKDEPGAKPIENVRGDIEFDRVYFRFNGDGEWVLRNLSLQVQAGQTVALVGMSGGGKSSLISLIPRFFDVQEGQVKLDGRNIRNITLKSLRSQIGMVLQDTFLFSGSVVENIRMGKADATMEEVVSAAQAAHAHGFISELPQGYGTEIGEKGVKLSGGQRQRLALARVFLKNPRILILDEATSALDLESEQLIQQALETLAKERTTLIVAHRLSTITHADQIVLIENGYIVEQGTHAELIQKQGAYYRLFTVQNLEMGVPKGSSL
jgi:ABC-type multidrug transport system fused ATPase/permease subunit